MSVPLPPCREPTAFLQEAESLVGADQLRVACQWRQVGSAVLGHDVHFSYVQTRGYRMCGCDRTLPAAVLTSLFLRQTRFSRIPIALLLGRKIADRMYASLLLFLPPGAPEVMLGLPWGEKVDQWGVGCILACACAQASSTPIGG